MTSNDRDAHVDAALEPETVQDIDPDADDTADVRGGPCQATFKQNPACYTTHTQ